MNNSKASKKCSEMKRVFGKKEASSFLVALMMMPSAAMAQSEMNSDSQRITAAALMGQEIKIIASSIISCMSETPRKLNAPIPTVKVPSKSYAFVLQEMQNQRARFLLPGSPVPLNARVVFQLESEDGMSQTVYFI